MNEERRYYVVDRVEGESVVLVSDEGVEVVLPASALPVAASPGSVLAVRTTPQRSPDWLTATLDTAERDRRLCEADARLKRLRRRDSGGDVSL